MQATDTTVMPDVDAVGQLAEELLDMGGAAPPGSPRTARPPTAEPHQRETGRDRGAVLTPPRSPVVNAALELAQQPCSGHTIDDAPALRHAIRVAKTLTRHVPGIGPEVAAAALLHDAPRFAPDRIRLGQQLVAIAPELPHLVNVTFASHEAMMSGQAPNPPGPPAVFVLAADTIVAFRSLVRRAHRSGDAVAFFASREALRGLIPAFNHWSDVVTTQLPQSMAQYLQAALSELLSLTKLTACPANA